MAFLRGLSFAAEGGERPRLLESGPLLGVGVAEISSSHSVR